jgi:S1-C subfamily serine protease
LPSPGRSGINGFDLIVVTGIAGFALAGWHAGLARVVAPVSATAAVLWLSATFAPRLIAEHTSPGDVGQRGWLALTAFAILPIAAGIAAAAVVGASSSRSGVATASRLCGLLAALGLAGLLLWIIAPVSQRQDAFVSLSQGSLTGRIMGALPAPPVNIDNVVARGVLPAPVASLLGSQPHASPPKELPPMTSATINLLRQATVQIFTRACGENWAGSGFAIAPGVIATNAHVVQGASQIEVSFSNGKSSKGIVTLYDAPRDLAVVSVGTTNAPPLALADQPAAIGQTVVSASHPNADRSLHIAPARVVAYGFDEFDLRPGGRTDRLAYTLTSSDLAEGSSGGPVVNAEGQVVAVEFAGSNTGTSFAFAVDEVRDALTHPGGTAVSTGDCPTDVSADRASNAAEPL